MVTVAEAGEIILSAVSAREPRILSLPESAECVLAADITSPMDLPLWDNSAVDGYALRCADVAGASENNPIHLRVIGEIPAGTAPGAEVLPQTCVRIFTGAPLPTGADAVVMQEDTKPHHEGYIAVLESADPGENVRRAGADVTKGEVVLRAGTLAGPAQLGLAAAIGLAKLAVRPRPRVGILVTGAEIVEPATQLRAGQIHDSNSYVLTALVRRAGCEAVDLGIADDTFEDLHEKIDYGLSECDAVITVGGVSVGEHDLVKQVLGELGCEQKFWKVAMRPGKPFVFGIRGDRFVFGLPGNPVSAAVTFLVLVRPALLKLRGLTKWNLPEFEAEAAEDFINHGDRLHFMRGRLSKTDGKWAVIPLPKQDSHVISSLADANCLIPVPGQGTLRRGTMVTAMVFDELTFRTS
ncbi:MAG TPA: gephyrin-like molybdotransferase Glp [Verrucomicrobiae bacterium]|nr:gephyrin-like molybdotransferase Glp [Verrucomicrobiae bacterium]